MSDGLVLLNVTGSIQSSASTLAASRRQRHTADVRDGSQRVVATVAYRLHDVGQENGGYNITVTRCADAGTGDMMVMGLSLAGARENDVVPLAEAAAWISIHTAIFGRPRPLYSVDVPPGIVVAAVDCTTGVFQLQLFALLPPIATAEGHEQMSPPISTIPVSAAVSLGSDCTVAQALRRASISGPSLPLDWVRSNPWGVDRLVNALGDDPSLVDDSHGTAEEKRASVSFMTRLTHVQGTNLYHRAPRDLPSATLTDVILLDELSGLVATSDEASKVQRRLPRLIGDRAVPQRSGALLLVHVGQTQPAEHMYATVDGCLAGCTEAEGGDLRVAAWNHLGSAARVLKHQHRSALTILLCCNVFSESFVLRENGMMLVHCSMGCGDTWTSTSARLAELLTTLFALT
jgi:hypothetical protein